MYRLKTFVRPVSTAAYRTLVKGAPERTTAVTLSPFAGRKQQARCYVSPASAESFLNGTSSVYVEEMYNAWLENPKSVHKVRITVTFWAE